MANAEAPSDNLATDFPDTALLAEGFAANASTLHAIQFRARLTNDQAAERCGVSLRTYRRWLANGNPNAGAVRLLAILAGYVPWDGWLGWEVHQGLLFPPGYAKHGIAPGEFFAVTYYRQSISAYRRRVEELEHHLGKLHDDLQKLRNRRAQACKVVGVSRGESPCLGGSPASSSGRARFSNTGT